MAARHALEAPAVSELPRWRLQLLGRARLVCEDPAAALPLSPKDAALLAVVALDGPVAADRVAALLWPAAAGRKAGTNLRQRLFRLRRDCGATLVTAGNLLQLAAGVDTDLASSLEAVADDADAAGEDFLAGLDFDDLPALDEWLRAARSRWRTRRDAAIADAAAACEAQGALERALRYAARLADSDPVSEHAQRRLMRLHYLRGDSSAAIDSFQRFEQRLKDEVGTRPSAETIELLATIEGAARTLPARRAVVPASLLRPPRLVGRAAEWAALAQAWDGQRAFVLVGEAGIGKTRLLQEFVAGGTQTMLVRARPGDEGMAGALLARLLRGVLARGVAAGDGARRQALALLLPELGDAATLSGAAQRLLLQRAAESTLADAGQAGLQAIVIDDLHFADEASVEFLQTLMQSEALAGLRWGCAQRLGDARPALQAWQGALLEARHLDRVELRPLSLAQVQELVESLALPELDAARLAPALFRHTGGNPLFALETLKDLLLAGVPSPGAPLPQPDTVGALIQRRLAQLSPGALKLARAAALAGPRFSAELAEAVLEWHPLDIAEPWRELEAAQVIRDGAFAHDLIFEAARASVPVPIAQLLHRRIAHFLQAQGAAPASVAPHWAGAQEWALAGQAHAAAARQAQIASQHGHEIGHWQAAHAAFERAGDADRSFDARCDSIPALIVVQGVAHAHTVIDGLLQQAHTDRQRVAALTARAMAALMAADHPTGVAAAVQAGELARGLDSPWPRFEAARLHAVGLAQGGQTRQALAVIEPLRDTVEREGSVQHRGRFWSDYAYVLNTARRLRDTAHALEKAIESMRAQGDLAELATLISNLATVKGNLGHADEALVLAQRALSVQMELGTTDGPTGGVVQTYVGLYCGMAGRFDQALQHLDAAVARFERDGQKTWIAVANNHRAMFLMQLGQFARARQALEHVAPSVESVRARSNALSARLDRALGHSGEAALQQALQILLRGGDAHVRMQTLLDEAERLEPDLALARCDEVMRMAQELEFGGVVMRAGLLQALFEHRAGCSEQAAARLRELLPRLPTLAPADMYLPDAWWIAVQVFDACGASDEALMALAQGRRWIRQTALPHVPEAFRDSFLQRNTTNRALCAAADRRLQ